MTGEGSGIIRGVAEFEQGQWRIKTSRLTRLHREMVTDS